MRAPPGLPPRRFDDSFRVFRKTEDALRRVGFSHDGDARMVQRVLLRNLWSRLNTLETPIERVRQSLKDDSA